MNRSSIDTLLFKCVEQLLLAAPAETPRAELVDLAVRNLCQQLLNEGHHWSIRETPLRSELEEWVEELVQIRLYGYQSLEDFRSHSKLK